MKNLLLFFMLMFSISAFSQSPIKSSGIWYFQDAPTTDANPPRGVEVSYSINLKKVYVWDRIDNQWVDVVEINSLSSENVEDIVSNLITSSPHNGLSVVYDDILGTLSFTVLDNDPLNEIQDAADVPVEDTAGLITGDNVETALNEAFSNINVLDQALANNYTLEGVPYFSTDLGTFTGSTISDNTTVKNALQELETGISNSSQNIEQVLATGSNANAAFLTNLGFLRFANTNSDNSVWTISENSSGDFLLNDGFNIEHYIFPDAQNVIQSSNDVMRRSDMEAVNVGYDNSDGNLISETVKTALDELSLKEISVSDFLYVSQRFGNNITATKGDLGRTWADPWAARDSAVLNDIIVILDGDFLMDIVGSSIGNILFPSGDKMASSLMSTKNLTYINAKGVRYTNLATSAAIPMFYDTVGVTIKFLGKATIDYSLYTGSSLGKVGPSGKQSDTRFTVEVDSFLVGSSSSSFNTAWTVGGFKEFNLSGDYLKLENVWFIRGWTNDTITNDLKITFNTSDWPRSSLTFAYPSVKGGSIQLKFGTLNVDQTAYSIDNIYMVDALFSLTCDNLNVRKTTPGSQDFFVRGNYSNPSRKCINSTFLFDIKNARLDGIRFSNGYSVRRPEYLGNKMVLTGNFFIKDSPLFSNKNDNSVTSEQMTYIIKNATIECENTPAIIVDETSGVFISNSFIDVKTDTCAILITNAEGSPDLITSYLKLQSGQLAIQSSVPGATARINGTYSNQTATDSNVDITVVHPYSYSAPIWNQETFTATAAQTTYTTANSKLPSASANLVLTVDGLEKTEGAAEYYTYVASTGIITFNTAFTGGEKVKIRWYD